MSHNIDHTVEEAGPPRASWWLDPSEPTPSSSGSHNEVMGFEEVTVKTAVVVEEHHHHHYEEEDEDDEDLVFTTNELCRTNSFDFVATQAQANNDAAAIAELIQKSSRYEGLSEPPMPGVLKGQGGEAEEFEMLEIGRAQHDLEAARPARTHGVPERRLLGWFEALSKRFDTVCEYVANQTRYAPYRTSR